MSRIDQAAGSSKLESAIRDTVMENSGNARVILVGGAEYLVKLLAYESVASRLRLQTYVLAAISSSSASCHMR
jgi:hypothetical protein